MLDKKVSFYLGKEKTDGYSGFFYDDGLFFVIEIEEGASETLSLKINQYFKKGFNIESLSDFDNLISQLITELNLPAFFSIACGYLKNNNVFYLKTIGKGKIFIKRDNKFGLLLDKDNTASGNGKVNDVFIFTTETLENLVNGEKGFLELLNNYQLEEIIEEIKLRNRENDDAGCVGLLLKLKQHEEIIDETIEDDLIMERKNSLRNFIKNFYLQLKTSKKIYTLILTLVLFGLFFWSVVLGYQRRINNIYQKKINESYELISQKTVLAEEVAFLNIERATILLKESKEEYNKLIQQVSKNKINDRKVQEMKKIINEAEKKIFKKEEAIVEEFYDLAIDNNNILISNFYLDEDNLLIIDKKNNQVYILSLEKKSLKKYQFNEIKQGSLFGLNNNEVYFYIKNKGIFKINTEEKIEKVVENDKDWKEIIDLKFYNDNLYLLDKQSDEIWKYLKSSESFSNKTSYFKKGESIDLFSIKSFAIDGAIYLTGNNLVLKYISGIREDFNLSLPDKEFNFYKIYTENNLEKLYFWDKKQGKVYITGKTGDYLEQINSQILKKAVDFVVYKSEIYLGEGTKILKIK